MHVTNDLQVQKDVVVSRPLSGGLARRFFTVWSLLLLAHFVARLATRYVVGGYSGLNRHAWVEIALIPLFQAGFLLALLETSRGSSLLRLFIQGIRRHPILGVALLSDLVLPPVFGWLKLDVLYFYAGARCLFVAGFALALFVRRTRKAGRGETHVFFACVILLLLPLVLIQALRLLGPAPIYYPSVWSTISVVLGLLLLNVIGLWAASSWGAGPPSSRPARSVPTKTIA